MHLHVWTDFTTAGSSNFDCNNARCWYPLCWPWACCASNCTLLAALPCFFNSFEVRACCDSAVDFTGEKVVSVVVIEVARDFYVAKQRISISWGVCRRSGARGELPPPRDGWWRLLASPRGIKLSLRTCRSTQSPSTSRRPSLEKSLSSPIMPCSRAYFVQGTKQSLPAGRPTACTIVDRSMDPELLTAKG